MVNVLFIAAGFGTRINHHLAKGLIGVGNKTIIERMLRSTLVSDIRNIAITTNAKFYSQYSEWLKAQGLEKKVVLLNNKVEKNEDRLGALGDILFALEKLSWGNTDLLVLPSDTLCHFEISEFLNFAQKMNPPGLVTAVNPMDKVRIANRLGCIIAEKEKVVGYVEKPPIPQSNLAIVPLYYYPSIYLPELAKYKKAGGNLDAPSMIISWFLENRLPVYCYCTNKPTLDVGTQADIHTSKSFVV